MSVSIILLSYNQEDYIGYALLALLNQECPAMEIIVSDDNSSDNTCKVIEEILQAYNGKHSVIFNRNEKNIGIAKHFSKVVFEFCHGDIILTADGDDISFPQRTQRTLDLFKANPDIMGLSFDKIHIDSDGTLLDSEIIGENKQMKVSFESYMSSDFITFCGSSRAFRREVMDVFGPLQYADGNDIFVFNRCLMMGGYLYSFEKMIYYRVHANNTDQARGYTKNMILQAKKQFITDLQLAVQKGLISTDSAKRVMRKRILPILRKFMEKHWSHYNPVFYKLIILIKRLKYLIKNLLF